ncbi:hypothetical protein Tco_1022202 [Tanacetum coccineum]
MGDISNEWDDVMDKIIRMACNNSIRSIVRRLVFAASTLYGMKEIKDCLATKKGAVSSEWQITMNNDNSKEVLMDEWKE